MGVLHCFAAVTFLILIWVTLSLYVRIPGRLRMYNTSACNHVGSSWFARCCVKLFLRRFFLNVCAFLFLFFSCHSLP